MAWRRVVDCASWRRVVDCTSWHETLSAVRFPRTEIRAFSINATTMLPFFKSKLAVPLTKRTKRTKDSEAMSWGACTGHGSWDGHEKIREKG